MDHHRPFTSLERYIRERLEGASQIPFLDAMPMYIATRLCELLGFVLEHGPNLKISEAAVDELSKAGGIGLVELGSGEAGMYAALDTLVSPVGLRTVRHRSDLGAFFEWLRPSSLGAEFDPLKNMVRDYIFRTYPCGEGDMVLGEVCTAQSRYSIHGAWQALGIQRNRMNRFLIAEGVAQKDEGEQAVRLKNGLNAMDVERIGEQMSNRLNSFEARDLLNVSAEFLQSLRDKSILKTVTDALDLVPKYEKSEIEGLIANLRNLSAERKGASANLFSIIEIARRLRCPAVDIVELMLNGKIAQFAFDEGEQGLAAFKIDLPQVRAALPQFEMEGLTKGDASRFLRVTYPTINHLIDEGLLTSKRVRNPKSRQFLNAICSESILDFQNSFETLGQLANRYGRASGPLGCHLEAKGICPLETPSGVSWYYERQGLEGRLRKAGLTMPQGRN